jgi:hypothetical protein
VASSLKNRHRIALMNAETLLDHLASDDAARVKAALQAAPALATELAALLPDKLNEMARRLEANPNDPTLEQAFWWMMLAGSLEVKAAHGALVRLFSGDEDLEYRLWSDLVTEDAKILLADTYAGNPQPLEALAANPTVSVWCRDAAVQTLAILTSRKQMPLEELTAIYTRLRDGVLREASETKPLDDFFYPTAQVATHLLMCASVDLGEPSLKAVLWPLVEADLCDECLCGLDEIEAGFAGKKQPIPGWDLPLGSDLWAHVKKWPLFDEIEGRPVYDYGDEGADEEEDWGDENAPVALDWAQPPAYPLPQTVVRTTPKVGRNDPCPCGSGKKFKKCCGS